MELHKRLRRYNRWRRGDMRMKQPDPTEVGELIEGAADRLEVLERENAEYFERWHSERRRREKLATEVQCCYQMLLTEPNTQAAMIKAENILREALAYSEDGKNVTD